MWGRSGADVGSKLRSTYARYLGSIRGRSGVHRVGSIVWGPSCGVRPGSIWRRICGPSGADVGSMWLPPDVLSPTSPPRARPSAVGASGWASAPSCCPPAARLDAWLMQRVEGAMGRWGEEDVDGRLRYMLEHVYHGGERFAVRGCALRAGTSGEGALGADRRAWVTHSLMQPLFVPF